MCKADCLALEALIAETSDRLGGALNYGAMAELARLHDFRADVMPDHVKITVPVKPLISDDWHEEVHEVRTWDELGDLLGY